LEIPRSLPTQIGTTWRMDARTHGGDHV